MSCESSKRVHDGEPTQTKALAAVIGGCSGLTPIIPARGQSFELE